jgi:hypothetical protein
MRLGSIIDPPRPVSNGAETSLYHLALRWLSKDREHRRTLEADGRKKRGARRDEVPSDSETFYRKYVIQTFFLGTQTDQPIFLSDMTIATSHRNSSFLGFNPSIWRSTCQL